MVPYRGTLTAGGEEHVDSKRRRPTSEESAEAFANRVRLIENLTFEVVPLKSLDRAVSALPAAAEVSVTCSPKKGIEETKRITDDLMERGFRAVPHISARLVRDRDHAKELGAWFRQSGITKIFVVGGDVDVPAQYESAAEFLDELLGLDHGLGTIGVTAYPDHHAFIQDAELRSALMTKQQLLAAAGVDGYCTTQMCFNPTTIAKWIRAERERGMTMPIHLGISGVVDRTKLVATGARLGVGQSLSYLRKNRTAVTKLLTTASFDPDTVLKPLSEDLLHLDVTGLHMFTFNQVAATNKWRIRAVSGR